MVTEVTKSCEKVALKFVCKNCDYETSKKSSYDKHLLTDKHTVSVTGDKGDTIGDIKVAKSCLLICEKCNKSYNSRNGLWKHKKNCKKDDCNDNTELVKYLMKENSELKNMILEVCKNSKSSEQNQINCNNTINSNNKTFNLNVFLNETCKDAMNINEFIDSIKLQLSDLERVGELGYVEGISNIIVKNLKQLDITQRPVHCTDKKRETIYIKDDDKWEKDEEKDKMHKIVRKVADKNARMLPKFKEAHPDCNKAVSKYSDAYNKIIVESMGGSGDNNFEKEEKIIKKVSKEIILEKEN